MDRKHIVEDAVVEGSVLSMRIDGKDYAFDIALVSKRFAGASQPQRGNFEISASGYGIHWPDIDEDLSIDGLLGVKQRPPAFARAS